ncbi:uncharacterized protein TRIADDRAFT_54155 [Trichoplax adhaerens]|uniref:Uncharacterized protein n=1 Tax=Trichoplax adhaerens TaxID=10228 RepID=B3RR95_TRIAD|nr:predicted protein [Trichoplax adhaerens]EDV26305.1 predicted protein [Trichoplax adhaerens]|eukprot:XP_002110301.1 predicted protein [Trichoplax adhaerens]
MAQAYPRQLSMEFQTLQSANNGDNILRILQKLRNTADRFLPKPIWSQGRNLDSPLSLQIMDERAKPIEICLPLQHYDLRLEIMDILQRVISYDIYTCYVNSSIDSHNEDKVRLLLHFLSLPYEDLAIKSMQLLSVYADLKLIQNRELNFVKMLAKAITLEKSVEFMHAAATVVNICFKDTLLSQHDHLEDLAAIACVLLQSNDVAISGEMISLLVQVSSETTSSNGAYIKKLFNLIPIGNIFEVLAISVASMVFNIITSNSISHSSQFHFGRKTLIYLKKMLKKPSNYTESQLKKLIWEIGWFAKADHALVQFPYLYGSIIVQTIFFVIGSGNEHQIKVLIPSCNLTQCLCSILLHKNVLYDIVRVVEVLWTILNKCQEIPGLLECNNSKELMKMEIICDSIVRNPIVPREYEDCAKKLGRFIKYNAIAQH